MDEVAKKKLRGNCKEIIQIVNVKCVIDQLYEDGMVTDDEMDSVTLIHLTKQEAMRKLMKILVKKQSFESFCKALLEDYDWLEKRIRETDPESVPDVQSSEEPQGYDELDYSTKLEVLQNQLWLQHKVLKDYEGELKKVKEDQNKAGPNVVVDKDEGRFQHLQKAMEKAGLSERDVVRMVEQFRNIDDIDSARASNVPQTSVDKNSGFIARSLAHDIVNYIALGEENAPAPSSQYEATMRLKVTEVTKNHMEFFESCLNFIKVEEINGFMTLRNILDEVLKAHPPPNWGRVVAVYAFCASLAKGSAKKGMKGLTKDIADFLGSYIEEELKEWIESEGGWDDFLEFFRHTEDVRSSSWKIWLGTVVGAAAIGLLSAKLRN